MYSANTDNMIFLFFSEMNWLTFTYEKQITELVLSLYLECSLLPCIDILSSVLYMSIALFSLSNCCFFKSLANLSMVASVLHPSTWENKAEESHV